MKPGSDAVFLFNRAGTSNQGQKRALKCVLRVMPLAQDCAAGSENHRAMAIDQNPEGIRVVRGHEPIEHLRIRHCVTPPISSMGNKFDSKDHDSSNRRPLNALLGKASRLVRNHTCSPVVDENSP
jgi:hypothetical protein